MKRINTVGLLAGACLLLAHCDKSETASPETKLGEQSAAESAQPSADDSLPQDGEVLGEEPFADPDLVVNQDSAEGIDLDSIEALLRAQAAEDVNSPENTFMAKYKTVLDSIDHNPDYVLYIVGESPGLREAILLSKLQQVGFCIESGMDYIGWDEEAPSFKKAFIVNPDEEEIIKVIEITKDFQPPAGYAEGGE